MDTSKGSRQGDYQLKVLIADDSIEARRSTRLMLSMHPGVEVVAMAQDGYQALQLAKIHKPDIAIVDINMPEMDGLSAIRAMREIDPGIVFIVISAEKDSQTLSDAAAAGAGEYLIKPFVYEDLERAIERSARIWMENRQRSAQGAQAPDEDITSLRRLANVYAQARRSDDQALEVFEKLAANPDCELRWLMILGMVYIIRHKWDKLKDLAARLEDQDKPDA